MRQRARAAPLRPRAGAAALSAAARTAAKAAANAVRDGARRGPGRRSAEESRLTRERLLLEAERHFARSGYAGTTVRELGAALGIAGSSVLHHVGSKRKLYAAVLERISASATAVLEGIERGDPARAMHQFTERFLAWSEAHPHYVEILLREMMENPARIGEVHRWLLADFVRQAVALTAEAVGERRAQQIDPDMLLMVLLGSVTYFQVARKTFAAIRGGDAQQQRRRFIDTLEAMLQASLSAAAKR